MCTNPKQIRNRTRMYIPGKDLPLVTVQCGKCAECQEQRSDDWLFRTYFDHVLFCEKYSENSTYFVTLTYNEKNIPYYELSDGVRQCCPDFSDVQKFLKMLRKRLDRPVLRYFCSVEYGHLSGRIHYHLMIYVNSIVSLSQFRRHCEYSWANFSKPYRMKDGTWNVDRFDSKGFVKPIHIKLDGTTRTFNNCMKYVCKYCSKDVYERNLEGPASARVRCSLGFGAGVTFTNQQLRDGFLWLPLGKQGMMKKYVIPHYYYFRLKVPFLEKEVFDENASYVDQYIEHINRYFPDVDAEKYLNSRTVPSDYCSELREYRLYNVAERYVDGMSLCNYYHWSPSQVEDIMSHLGFNVLLYRQFLQLYSRDDLIEYFVHVRPYIPRQRPKFMTKFPDYFWFSHSRTLCSRLDLDIDKYRDVENLFIVRDYLLELDRIRRHNVSEYKHTCDIQPSFNLKNQKYGKEPTDCRQSSHRMLVSNSKPELYTRSLDSAVSEAERAGIRGSDVFRRALGPKAKLPILQPKTSPFRWLSLFPFYELGCSYQLRCFSA